MIRAYQIAKYWLQNQDPRERAMVVDLGEPSCFACDWWDEDAPTGSASAWDFQNSGLERAHIVPRALGGSDHPSNLLMLCKKCHADSPDVADPRIMFEWIKNRRKYPMNNVPDMSGERDFQIACELADGNDVDWARVQELQSELIREAGTHGVSFSPGTIAYTCRRAVEMAIEESRETSSSPPLMSWVPCA